jgi:hypothetical protein
VAAQSHLASHGLAPERGARKKCGIWLASSETAKRCMEFAAASCSTPLFPLVEGEFAVIVSVVIGEVWSFLLSTFYPRIFNLQMPSSSPLRPFKAIDF